MDRRNDRHTVQDRDDSPPSEAWLFAQAILGKPIPNPASAEAHARAECDVQEFAASISPQYARQLRRERDAKSAAAADRELLVWAAQISTRAEVKLRAIQQVEQQQRRALQAAKQFMEANSLLTEWNEADHPRAPKGTPIGGQWVDKGGGGSGAASRADRLGSGSERHADEKREPDSHMLELAHTWWQTKGALEQTRRDIEELPGRIASERAQLRFGGRPAPVHAHRAANAQRELDAAKALAPELEKQLRELEQQYQDLGYEDVPYSAWTPGETFIAGRGIEEVGRAVALSGRPAGLTTSSIDVDIATLVLGAPAALRLGKALLSKTAARSAGSVSSKAATLRPYGGAGGGHHVPAKSAFKGAATYDAKAALALPNEELAKLNVRHAAVTGAQKRLYREFASRGAKLTWEEVERIETEALVRGGLNSEVARATVRQAIEALKNAGVPGPARIPWGD
jgi:hypothetical protein